MTHFVPLHPLFNGIQIPLSKVNRIYSAKLKFFLFHSSKIEGRTHLFAFSFWIRCLNLWCQICIHILCYIMLNYIISYYIILCYIILYYIILYKIIYIYISYISYISYIIISYINIWSEERYTALISLLCLHFFEKLQYHTFGKQELF